MSDCFLIKSAHFSLLHCSSTPGVFRHCSCSIEFTLLLSLEQKDGAVTQVEVDEVLGLCINSSVSSVFSRLWSTLPCVTKLPKFLPTMQCQVTPLRSSNCPAVSLGFPMVISVWRTVFLMWCAMSCNMSSASVHDLDRNLYQTYLFDVELFHGFLCCERSVGQHSPFWPSLVICESPHHP